MSFLGWMYNVFCCKKTKISVHTQTAQSYQTESPLPPRKGVTTTPPSKVSLEVSSSSTPAAHKRSPLKRHTIGDASKDLEFYAKTALEEAHRSSTYTKQQLIESQERLSALANSLIVSPPVASIAAGVINAAVEAENITDQDILFSPNRTRRSLRNKS